MSGLGLFLLILLPFIHSHPTGDLPPEAFEALFQSVSIEGDSTDQYCRSTGTCQVVAFGNSLTDDGINPLTGDKHGFTRISNGPIWVEYLANYLGYPCTSINNYAYSGGLSGMGNFYFSDWSGGLWQVETFIEENPSIPESMLIAFEAAGNNDLFLYAGNETGTLMAEEEIVENNILAVETLLKAGARRIVFFELVDGSVVPNVLLPGYEPIAARLSQSVQTINYGLKEKITALQVNYPDARIAYVDTDNLFAHAIKPNFPVVEEAFTHHKPETYPFEPINYAWFDGQHPNTHLHQIIGRMAYEAWMDSSVKKESDTGDGYGSSSLFL